MVTVARGDQHTTKHRPAVRPAPPRSSRGSRLLAAAVVALLCLLLVPAARAEVESVRAEASPQSLLIGETFVYQVVVTGSGTLPTPRNNIPDSFQILSGPNSNFSMQIVNGRMSSTRTLSYTLRGLRRGEHTIPAPTVRDKGKDIRGNSVTIRVAGPDDDPVTGKAPGEEEEGPATRARDEEELSGRNLPSMFLRAHVNKDNVYLQEPLVISFTLYFQPSVQTYDVQRLPSTEGFWTEEWKVPDPPPVVERNLGGSLFKAAEIHRLILYPTKTGELTIGPMDVMLQYLQTRRNSRDLFDSFFRQSHETKLVSSQELTVNVKPLPDGGKPADFANVVGDYRVRASMDSDTVQTNESVTLTFTVEGEGNVGFLPAPELRVPADIELYEPEQDVSKSAGNGVIRGRKTFKWLLIPRRPGQQRIPPVQYSFFDPEAGTYRTLQADPGTLTVIPAAGWAADEASAGTPAPVESVGRDIRWIQDTAPTLADPAPPLHQRAGYWSLYALPVLIAVGGIAVRRRRATLAGQETLQRSRKAAKRAMTALKGARAEHEAGNVPNGFDALARGIISYLAERLGLPAASLDVQLRRDALTSLEVSQSNRDELEEILNLCNTARFSPHGSEAGALASAIERAKSWITTVDRKLKPVA